VCKAHCHKEFKVPPTGHVTVLKPNCLVCEASDWGSDCNVTSRSAMV
jgi:hypothetical protein